MKKSFLEKSLKTILIGCAICGLGIYFYGFPEIGRQIIKKYPEFHSWFLPWLLFLWATGVPCFAALVYGWKIIATLQKGTIFSHKNAARLRTVSGLAVGDALLLFIGNLILLLCNMNHPGVVIISLGISLVGLAISVVCQGLALLTDNAADLQEQSDFTI